MSVIEALSRLRLKNPELVEEPSFPLSVSHRKLEG